MPQGSFGAQPGDPADVLVIFGITGDLAKVMTFHSLYRLERRGLLDCPIVGVAGDDWTIEHLRDHARTCVENTGETIDDDVWSRLSGRLSYISGDFTEPSTFTDVSRAIEGKQLPVFYLEIPPFLFSKVVEGLSEAGLTEHARIAIEKPFGHDEASAHELAQTLHQYVDESQLYRIDHFLGKMGLEEILYLRFANMIWEPVWNRHYVSHCEITMGESFGVEDRGHFYDPVGALRDVVVNHLMQVVAAAAMDPPSSGDADTLKNGQLAVFRATATADGAKYVRGQYDGYLDTNGVAAGSTTETYVALRLEIDNFRWSGVPFVIRTGKHLAATQTELRLVYKRPPQLRFGLAEDRPPDADQLVIKLDPTTGLQVLVEARRADATGPQGIEFDMEFADEGGEGPTPYEVLLHAALIGDPKRFKRQDAVEETWRIMQPLLDAPPPVHQYEKGTWGPPEADRLVADVGGWHGPWVVR